MKPLQLYIEGINSFIQQQKVDFNDLSSSNIFCITGNTGSGKTTILDCIILSLYGGGKRSSKTEDYINLLRQSAYVCLEFEADYNGLKCFRVEREFFRGNKPNKATLTCLDDNQIMDTGVDSVNSRILEMIDLSREDFTKVVILEQGEFDKFLNSGKAERMRTVSNLFKLQRFDELTKKVNVRIKAVNANIENLDNILQPHADLTQAKIALAEKECKALEKNKVALDTEQKELTCQKDKMLTEKGKWDKYDAAVKSLPDLLKQIDLCKDEKYKADSDYNSIIKKKDEVDSKRGQVGELKQQIEGVNKLRPKVNEIKAVEKQLKELRDKFKLTESSRKSLEEQCFSTNAKLIKHTDEIKQYASVSLTVRQSVAEYLSTNKAAADKAQADLDRQKSMNAAAAVASELNDGDDCPVCGGVFHTAMSDAGDLSKLLMQADSLKLAYDKADKLCREFDGLYNYVAENCTYELTTGKFDGDEVAALEFVRNFKAVLRAADEGKKAYDKQSGELKLVGKDCERLQSEGKSLREKYDGLKQDLGDIGDIEGEINRLNLALSNIDGEIAKFERERNNAEERQRKALAVLTRVNSQYEERLSQTLIKPDFDDKVYDKLMERLDAIKRESDSINEKLGGYAANISTMRSNLVFKRLREVEKKELVKNLDNLKILSSLFAKNAFMEYVSEEYIDDFTDMASERMKELTNGKFTLEYTEGEFYVRDFLRANEKRKVSTLSGGETFLCSLSMAIAISREIARYRNFEFFFLDEGFGTLHVDAIDTVSDALTALSQETMVGIVTHRSELVERIPKKIEVMGADIDTGSVIV